MPDHTYVVRFGPTPRDLLLIPLCLSAAVFGVWAVVTDGGLVYAIAALFGAGYVVLSVWAWLSRRVAVAVTAQGLTLGQAPPWPARNTAFVPWSDVEGVVLWRQGMWWRSVRYLGVLRRADAPPLPGSARNATLRKANKAVVPEHLPEDLVADSRPIVAWYLNKSRLTAAINHFRPDLPVEDHT